MLGRLQGGPEPLENEINNILGSKREDRFSDHFSDLVQNITGVVDNIDQKLSRYFILDPRSTAIRSECNPIDRRYRPYSAVSVILSTVDIDRDQSTGR